MASQPPLPESTVLLPRDPALTNTDDWPEFVLLDAIVQLPDKTKPDPTSLFQAHVNFPLRVTGRLETPPPQDQVHLWQPAYRTVSGSTKRRRATQIQLDDVRSFAYGAYPDGAVEIWAGGNAGWFVLRPSRQYRQVYEAMTDAVNVLYSIVDVNSSSKAPPSAAQVFKAYSREIAGDANDAAEKIYSHRDFLLGCMMGGREGLAWGRLPIYRHLCGRFPEDVERIRKRWQGSGKRGDRNGGERRSRTGSMESHSAANGTLKRKRAGRQGSGAHSPTPEPDDEDSVQVASDVVERGASATSARRARGQPKDTSQRTQSREVLDAPATPSRQEDSDVDLSRTKNKSGLRPKPMKPSKGPPKRSEKSNKGNEATADDLPDEPPDRMAYATTRSLQKAAPEITDSNGAPHASVSPYNVDEGIDMPSSPSAASEDSAPSPQLANGIDPISNASLETMAAPDPVQEETWVCALDGCAHKVYGSSSSSDVQTLIREHYALHAYDNDRRVELVRTLMAPSLPAAHLLERVKRQAHADGFPPGSVAGSRFPEPLRRKF